MTAAEAFVIELRLLGGVVLKGSDGSELRTVVAQPKPLLLLAFLALTPDPGYRRRDTLLAAFWPELDDAHARGALRQTLHVLRRELGEGAVVGRGVEEVGVARDAIALDVWAFDAACADGRWEDAVVLYRGDLLAGLYAEGGSNEMQDWLDAERGRCRRAAAGAARELALARLRAGDQRGAAAAARLAIPLVPEDETQVRELLRLLDEAGDRAGALRAYEEFAARLRQELDATPAPETQALVEAIQRRRGARAGADAADLRASPTPDPPIPSALAGVEPEPGSLTPGSRSRRSMLALGIGAIALTAVGWGLARRGGPSGAALPVVSGVAIQPFTVRSPDSSLAPLRELLARDLADAFSGGPRAAADELVSGSVSGGAGAPVLIDATVARAGDHAVVAHTSVRGPVDALPALADSLVRKLLALRAGEDEARLPDLATRSLPALQAYLLGRTDYRRGESGEATARYVRALELDSTFALAALELVSAADRQLRWGADAAFGYRVYGINFGRAMLDVGGQTAWGRAIEIARRNRDRLDSGDRIYLDALIGPAYPEDAPARQRLADWQRAVDAIPHSPEAWYRLGQMLLYCGASLGISDWAERAAAAYQQALRLDPGFIQPVAGLVELAGRAHDTTGMRRLAARYLAVDSVGETADYVRWHVLAAAGDGMLGGGVRGRFDSLDAGTLDRIEWTSQMESLEPADAEHAFAVLLRRSVEPDERTIVLFARRFLALNQGHPDEALRLGRAQLETDGKADHYYHYNLVNALFWGGDSAAGREGMERMPDERPLWELWHGVTSSAPTPATRRHPIDLYLEAMRAVAAHREDAARLVARADSAAGEGCCSHPHFGNLIVARLYEEIGDVPSALAVLRRQRGWYAPIFLSTVLRQEGRLAVLAGEPAEAGAAYRAYLRLRPHPEPPAAAEVARVRAALDSLELPAAHHASAGS